MAALCIRAIPDTARAWVVAPHLRAQESIAAQLETWGVRNILFVPEKEVALGEEVGDPELAAERLNVLHRIASGRLGKQTIVVAEGSLNDEVPSVDGMQNQGMTLKTGETHAPDELIRLFEEAGFEGRSAGHFPRAVVAAGGHSGHFSAPVLPPRAPGVF